jgi:hypothetical protein
MKSYLIEWLNREAPRTDISPVHFDNLLLNIRPGDIVLVEGRTRVSEVIRLITQSRWTHSALYIGRPAQYQGTPIYDQIHEHWDGSVQEPLVLEGLLGKGTVLTPLESYRGDNVRLCRPDGITLSDLEKVIEHVIGQLGTPYNVRQLFDLARFFMPWGLVPRRWRSSLFEVRVGEPTKTVCSTLIAEAFAAVKFPILPHIYRTKEGEVRLIERNPKLYVPADFDYSPYFSVHKFPPLTLTVSGNYQMLPWDEGILLGGELPTAPKEKKDQET